MSLTYVRIILIFCCVAALGMTVATFWASSKATASFGRLESLMTPPGKARSVMAETADQFQASWQSGAPPITITVTATKNDGESAEAFAQRCLELVNSQKAKFPPV